MEQTHYVFNRIKLRYHDQLITHTSLLSFSVSVMHQQDAYVYLVLLQEIIECEARILTTCLHTHSVKTNCVSSISTCIQNSPTSADFLRFQRSAQHNPLTLHLLCIRSLSCTVNFNQVSI